MNGDQALAGLDRSLISLQEDYEIRYWSKIFAIDQERLREIVAKVGNAAADVRDYLAANRQ